MQSLFTKALVFLCFISMLPMWCNATTGIDSPEPIIIPIKKEHKDDPITRPQKPSRQAIVATYYNGILNIEFLMAEGDGAVYVYGNDGSCSLCENFDTSVPATFMLEDITLTSYTIIIETDAGHTYSGVLNLNL